MGNAHPLSRVAPAAALDVAALMSPAFAMSTTFLAIASAPSSIAARATSVTRLRLPLGRPFGLPDWPGFQPGRRCSAFVISLMLCSSTVFFQCSASW